MMTKRPIRTGLIALKTRHMRCIARLRHRCSDRLDAHLFNPSPPVMKATSVRLSISTLHMQGPHKVLSTCRVRIEGPHGRGWCGRRGQRGRGWLSSGGDGDRGSGGGDGLCGGGVRSRPRGRWLSSHKMDGANCGCTLLMVGMGLAPPEHRPERALYRKCIRED